MKWFPKLKQIWSQADTKMKIVLILFCIGLLCLCFPATTKKQASTEPQSNMINQKNPTSKELEKLLTELTGKKVKVLLTYQDSGSVEVISEENRHSQTQKDGSSQVQQDTKPVLDSNKNIIIKNHKQPKIKGVCIFYFGPYHVDTEMLLCRAAKGALGAELHTVEVICMP